MASDIVHEITGNLGPGKVGRYEVLWRETGQPIVDAHAVLVPPMLVKGYEPTPFDAAVVAGLNAHSYAFKVVDRMTGQEVPPEQLPRVLIPERDPAAWWALRAVAFNLEAQSDEVSARRVREIMNRIAPQQGYDVGR